MTRTPEERKKLALQIGRLITLGKTIRQAAEILKMKKSTTHVYIHTELKEADEKLYKRTLRQLKKNIKDGHVKGGKLSKSNGKEEREDEQELSS